MLDGPVEYDSDHLEDMRHGFVVVHCRHASTPPNRLLLPSYTFTLCMFTVLNSWLKISLFFEATLVDRMALAMLIIIFKRCLRTFYCNRLCIQHIRGDSFIISCIF